ncbi:MAG: TonB-dependent receptor [Weeksellaceae bacterium]|nr:TonB-dependent receptor [Weeksellaceae bacterium]
MKQGLVIFLLFLTTSLSVAQENCTFRGTLVDSLALPINDASITAFNNANRNTGYTFSDDNGEFRLEMPCGQAYELEIEHLHFESKIHKIQLDRNLREQIILSRSTVQLSDVIAQGVQPIAVRGDTIEYNVDSFTTGSEENLEDVLRKLPGIEVEDGKVYYQGKEINSIKVEGREIFGGNTKLLTKNLPSEVIDKVQLNQRFRANPFASSLQQDEQPELNIVLKEDKKNLIFGNMTLGGDARDYYDANVKAFRFTPTADYTVIGDMNNYGKEVFSNEDYFQFLGGMSELMEEGGTMALRSSLTGVNFSTGGNAAEMYNHILAGHFGYEPNKKLYATGFGMVTDNGMIYRSNTERIYPDFTQRDVNSNENNVLAGLARLRIDYKFNERNNLTYRANYNVQENKSLSRTQTTTDIPDFPEIYRNIYSERLNTSLNQRLSYRRRVGNDHNFGLYLTHLLQTESPDREITSDSDPFFGLFDLVQDNQGFALRQNQKLQVHNMQALSIYNHLITNTSNIRFKLGSNLSFQNLSTTLRDLNSQNPQLISDFTPSAGEMDYFEAYLDATYTKKINKLKVDAGLGLHRFYSEMQANLGNALLEQWRLQPHFQARYEFSTVQNLDFNYGLTYSLPQIREWMPGYDIQSYFSIYQGNPALRESAFHEYSLRYGHFNQFKFQSFYTSFTYSRRVNSVRNQGVFNALYQINSPFNVQDPENNYSANAHWSRRFTPVYSLRLTAFANYSDFVGIINGVESPTNTYTHRLSVRNSIKWRKQVEGDFGINWTYNNYSTREISSQFHDLTPFIRGAWVINDILLLQANYELRNQWSQGELINEYHDLGANLRYKIARKTDLYLYGGNLLNNRYIINNSFNDFFTTVTAREVLGRYVLASVRYRF